MYTAKSEMTLDVTPRKHYGDAKPYDQPANWKMHWGFGLNE